MGLCEKSEVAQDEVSVQVGSILRLLWLYLMRVRTVRPVISSSDGVSDDVAEAVVEGQLLKHRRYGTVHVVLGGGRREPLGFSKSCLWC